MVPFLHVTSKTPDEPKPELLDGTGGRGWPHLVYLGADGRVLGSPAGRTVAAFADGAAKFGAQVDPELKRMHDLQSKVDAGDESLRPQLLLARMGLLQISTKDADRELADLGDGVNPEVAKEFAKQRDQLESRELIQARPWERAAADRRLLAMYADGFRPSGRETFDVWERLATHAEKSSDLEMYQITVDAMAKILGDAPAVVDDDAPVNAKEARQRIRLLRHQKSLAEIRSVGKPKDG